MGSVGLGKVELSKLGLRKIDLRQRRCSVFHEVKGLEEEAFIGNGRKAEVKLAGLGKGLFSK